MISVVITAFNEEKIIAQTVDMIHTLLKKQKIEYEIIIINDGSTDRTEEILNKFEDIILISRKINRGYGFSLKEGIKKSKGEMILIIDADGSYPLDEIPNLITKSSSYDMVVGERSGKNVSIGLLNRFGKLIIRCLIYFLSSIWIKDINSGLRIFKKELIEKYWNIIPDGFSLTTTLTIASLLEKCRIKFIPINYYKRIGKSKIRPFRDFFNFVILVFRIISFFKPLRFYLPIAIFFLIMSVFRAIRDITLFNSIETAAVLLFIIGIQTLFFGLLADLIVAKHKNI